MSQLFVSFPNNNHAYLPVYFKHALWQLIQREYRTGLCFCSTLIQQLWLTASLLKDVLFCTRDAEVNKKDKVSAHSLPGEAGKTKSALEAT